MTITVLRCRENLVVRLGDRVVTISHQAFAVMVDRYHRRPSDFPIGRTITLR